MCRCSSVLCAVFCLCCVPSLVCVMDTLQPLLCAGFSLCHVQFAVTNLVASPEHASLRSVGKARWGGSGKCTQIGSGSKINLKCTQCNGVWGGSSTTIRDGGCVYTPHNCCAALCALVKTPSSEPTCVGCAMYIYMYMYIYMAPQLKG